MGAALDEMRRHHEAMKVLDARMAVAIKRAEEDDAALGLDAVAMGIEDDCALLLEPKGWGMVPGEGE